jgi:hypothetical protein
VQFHVNVITATPRTGTKPNASGGFSKWLELQGVLVYEDGRQEVFVYSMWAKRGEELPTIVPGTYTPVVELKCDWQTRKLAADIVKLVPVQVGRGVAPARAAA